MDIKQRIGGHSSADFILFDIIVFSKEEILVLNRISNELASVLLKKAKKTQYDREVYVYGLELIISTLAGMLSILAVSTMLSDITAGLVFLFSFVPLRLFTGGYHASTYGKCFLVSNISYIVLILINNLIWKTVGIGAWVALFVVISLYIAHNAPQVNVHQNINLNKRKRSNRIVKNILVLDVIWIAYLGFHHYELMCVAILSVCLVAVFMLLTNKSIMKGVMES